MILTLAFFVAPWLITFAGNRQLETIVAAHARRFGVRRDVTRELWRDRGLIIAHAIFALGMYPALIGIVFHSEIGSAQYVLYGISIVWVSAATFHKIRVVLAIMARSRVDRPF